MASFGILGLRANSWLRASSFFSQSTGISWWVCHRGVAALFAAAVVVSDMANEADLVAVADMTAVVATDFAGILAASVAVVATLAPIAEKADAADEAM